MASTVSFNFTPGTLNYLSRCQRKINLHVPMAGISVSDLQVAHVASTVAVKDHTGGAWLLLFLCLALTRGQGGRATD